MEREKLDKDEFVTLMQGGTLGSDSGNPIEAILNA